MKPELKTGLEGRADLVVANKDTAIAYGSGSVSVFATPAMVALMEKTANDSVEPFLNEGMVTVGSEISVKHIKATRLGKKVWARSVLDVIDGKKLVFSVEASDEDGKIGFGSHTRYIANREKF